MCSMGGMSPTISMSSASGCRMLGPRRRGRARCRQTWTQKCGWRGVKGWRRGRVLHGCLGLRLLVCRRIWIGKGRGWKVKLGEGEEDEERFYSPFGGNGAYWTQNSVSHARQRIFKQLFLLGAVRFAKRERERRGSPVGGNPLTSHTSPWNDDSSPLALWLSRAELLPPHNRVLHPHLNGILLQVEGRGGRGGGWTPLLAPHGS
jgi:hypothetical protein